jgi:TPR repeat protein/cellulose biosynthesis protein BcsQ
MTNIEPNDSLKPPGHIYTFYSYKGGVGRSMALVNVGVLLALDGRKVLLVDWDLEAPGLETFFVRTPASNVIGKPEKFPGIVDLLESQANGETIPWRKCLLRAEFGATSLDIISAGRKSDDYRHRVQQLDWSALFRESNIGKYLDSLRDEWRESYDFVLIDSRTGITDIGDICTVLMPDALVAMYVNNYQNIDGVKAIVERARSARSRLPVDRSMLVVVPLLGRDERTEYDKSMSWKELFEKEFGYLFKDWLPSEFSPRDVLSKLFIPYVPIWSFGERIPVLENEHELRDPTTIGSAYLRLATLLGSRLDWYAVYEKTDLENVKSTQIELAATRRVAETSETEIRLKEAELEHERLARESAEKEQERLAAVVAAQAARARRAKALTFFLSTMAALVIIGTGWWALEWVRLKRAPDSSVQASASDSDVGRKVDQVLASLTKAEKDRQTAEAKTAEITTQLAELTAALTKSDQARQAAEARAADAEKARIAAAAKADDTDKARQAALAKAANADKARLAAEAKAAASDKALQAAEVEQARQAPTGKAQTTDPTTSPGILTQLEKAAAAGDPNAMVQIGYLYRTGQGVRQDYAAAKRWYEKAAAAGDSNAMVNLGDLFSSGQGVTRDYVQAMNLYEKAIMAGNSQAMINLGDLYRDGRGVPVDLEKARLLYQKAAAAGSSDAEKRLAPLSSK